MGKIKDLNGQIFGKLKVIKFSHLDKNKGLSIWLCQCECGKEKLFTSQVLKKCVSCGCYRNEIAAKRIKGFKNSANTKNDGIYIDGKRHPAYVTWCGMKARCFRTTCKEYRWYGAKGIKICDEWKNSPEIFIHWADKNGYKKGLCIDRIDPDKDYMPQNCQFITKTENLKKVRADNLKKGYIYSRGRIPKIG